MCVCLRQGLGWNQRQSSLAYLPFPTSPLPQRWGSEPGDSPASLGLFFLPLKPAVPLLLIELFPTHLPCACIWREEPTSSSCKDLKPLGEREIDRSHVDLWDIAAHSLIRKHPVLASTNLTLPSNINTCWCSDMVLRKTTPHGQEKGVGVGRVNSFCPGSPGHDSWLLEDGGDSKVFWSYDRNKGS